MSLRMVLLAIVLTFGIRAFGEELAKVNGVSISDQDIKMALGDMPDFQKNEIFKDPNSKARVLDEMINQEVLVQEAQKEKVEDNAKFKTAFNQMKRQMLATYLVEKTLDSKLTDKEAKSYFEKNKSKYSTDQVHAMHILLDNEAKAKEVMAEAQKSGADFQALAEKYSKDPSAKTNRGDLGFFTRDRMVPEFSKAAFGGKNNSIVGPVKSAFGYHIIKVVEHKPGKALEYGEVEMKVKNDLKMNLVTEYIASLRSKAKVTVSK